MEDDFDDETNEAAHHKRPEQVEEIEAYVPFARIGQSKRALLRMNFRIELAKAFEQVRLAFERGVQVSRKRGLYSD